jgi:drug/metabolite transporter (DMT)-like permease
MGQSLWMLFAALLFALMGITIKASAALGYSTAELVFYRSLIGWIFISLVILLRGYSIRTPYVVAHLQRGVAGTFAIWLFMYAVVHLPLATAITLNFTAPLWIGLILALVFGEKLSRTMVFALLLGFVGIIILLQPIFSPDKRFDITIGLISGVAAAVALLNVRRLGGLGEPEWRIFWWFSGVITAGSALWLTVSGGWLHHSLNGLHWLLAMGAVATAGQLAQTRAYAQGKTLLSASFSYASVPFSALAAWLVYDEAIAFSGWIAMAIIVSSGLIATWRTHQGNKAVTPEPPAPS